MKIEKISKMLDENIERTRECIDIAQLGLYIDKELSKDESDKLERHLSKCLYCQKELVEIKKMLYASKEEVDIKLKNRLLNLPDDIKNKSFAGRVAIIIENIHSAFIKILNPATVLGKTIVLGTVTVLLLLILFPISIKKDTKNNNITTLVNPTSSVKSIGINKKEIFTDLRLINQSIHKQAQAVKYNNNVDRLLKNSIKDILKIVNYSITNKINITRLTEIFTTIKKNILIESSRGFEGSKVYKNTASSVVLIVANDGFGSGIVIDKPEYIITNWHVVLDKKEVLVFFKPSKGIEIKKDNAYKGEVIKVDQTTDLALIKLSSDAKKVKPLLLGDINNVEVGQDVHAIGHSEGEIWTYTLGTISQIRPNYEWNYISEITHKCKVIQTQTPINPGNSGGPLLNDKAEVIGINSFTKAGAGLNYAIASDVITNFLKSKQSKIIKKLTKLDKKYREDDFLYHEYDTNKDGIIDVVGVDVNHDNKDDMWIYDDNQDGTIDYIGLDQNKNGIIDTILMDLDNNEIYETWLYDTNEDGTPDLIGKDNDGDFVVDKYEKYYK